MVSGGRSKFSVAERALALSVAEREGATIVTAQSAFRPNNELVRAMLPLIRRKVPPDPARDLRQAPLVVTEEAIWVSSSPAALSVTRAVSGVCR